MTIREYPRGVTCWIDLAQPDLEAARRFYAELFDWTVTAAEGAEAYLIAGIDGREVAGLTVATSEGSGPAAWNTYVATDDADATAAAVTANGGTVARAPVDTAFGARVAACVDPTGARFGLWQAAGRPGAQYVNAPGGWNFSDLHTPDRAAAEAFYGAVFGWRMVDLEQGAGTMLQLPGYGDHLAATIDPGIHERQAMAPPGFADVIGGLAPTGPDEPARWAVTFTVADRDRVVDQAVRLGATILRSSDDPWTRNATVRDPQGAEFVVSQFTPPEA